MTELAEGRIEILRHLANGGLVAMRIYGKRTTIIDVASHPNCIHVGIKSLTELEDAGLLRVGDPSPYKTGKSIPYLLTDKGKSEVIQRDNQGA